MLPSLRYHLPSWASSFSANQPQIDSRTCRINDRIDEKNCTEHMAPLHVEKFLFLSWHMLDYS